MLNCKYDLHLWLLLLLVGAFLKSCFSMERITDQHILLKEYYMLSDVIVILKIGDKIPMELGRGNTD